MLPDIVGKSIIPCPSFKISVITQNENELYFARRKWNCQTRDHLRNKGLRSVDPAQQSWNNPSLSNGIHISKSIWMM